MHTPSVPRALAASAAPAAALFPLCPPLIIVAVAAVALPPVLPVQAGGHAAISMYCTHCTALAVSAFIVQQQQFSAKCWRLLLVALETQNAGCSHGSSGGVPNQQHANTT